MLVNKLLINSCSPDTSMYVSIESAVHGTHNTKILSAVRSTTNMDNFETVLREMSSA